MRSLTIAAALAAACTCNTAEAANRPGTTVVNFDDLTPAPYGTPIPVSYGGISWDSDHFGVYDTQQDPYNPSSGLVRALTNRTGTNFAVEDISFSFANAVRFDGMFFAGSPQDDGLRYTLSLGGVDKASVNVLVGSAPTFFSSGYVGAIDRVTITGVRGYYVFDDVTYGGFGAGVPEPATWAIMILGFGAVGGAMRRRQAPTRLPALS